MKARDRRALALGVTTIAVSWLGLSGIPDATSWLGRMELELEQRADLVARARGRLEAVPALADSVTAFEALGRALPRAVLAGRDVETASVDLRRRIMDVVVRFATFQAFDERLVGPRAGSLEMVTLRARFETDFGGLMKVLRDVEVDSAMSVETLIVSASEPHAVIADPEKLDVVMGIAGWYQTGDSLIADGGSRAP